MNLFARTARPGGQERLPFSAVWARIVQHEGETFHLVRGAALTYAVVRDGLIPSRTDYFLARRNFEAAWARMPLAGPKDIADLQGPSYVYAILTDPRICGGKTGA